MLMAKCDACKKNEISKKSDVYWKDWRMINVLRTSGATVTDDLHICPDCYHRIGELMNLFTDKQGMDNDGTGND